MSRPVRNRVALFGASRLWTDRDHWIVARLGLCGNDNHGPNGLPSDRESRGRPDPNREE
jgi:hypothetical protein